MFLHICHVQLTMSHVYYRTHNAACSIDLRICVSVDRSIYLLYQIIDRINLSTYNQPSTMTKKADCQDDSTECLRAKADDEINHNIYVVDKATAKLREKLRPKNTNDQYRPKILEFKAFCRLKYAGEGETIVTIEKVHKFLFYQAHKQKIKGMKGQERMIDHDGSKAKKGMLLYRSYACPLNVLCGTILECIMWKNP
jgi:hypothetical protein